MTEVTKKLTKTEVSKKLKTVPLWVVNAKETEISRKFETYNFLAGLSIVAKIAVHAEIIGHHPSMELSYDSVKVRLSTHDVKGLSRLDFELAKRIDNLKI